VPPLNNLMRLLFRTSYPGSATQGDMIYWQPTNSPQVYNGTEWRAIGPRVPQVAAGIQPILMYGSTTGSTDANGDTTHNFAAPFSTGCFTVVAVNGEPNRPYWCVVDNANLTASNFKVRWYTQGTSAATAAASGLTMRVAFWAIGY